MLTNLQIFFSPTDGALTVYDQLRVVTVKDGWQALFQGYLEPGGPRRLSFGNAGLSMPVDAPALTLTSRIEWLELLRNIPGVLEDNDGRVWLIEEFAELCESKAPGKICPMTGLWLENPNTSAYRNRCLLRPGEKLWLDAEGFAFYSGACSRSFPDIGADRPGAFN